MDALVAVIDHSRRVMPDGALALVVGASMNTAVAQAAADRSGAPVRRMEDVMRCADENVAGRRTHRCRLVGVAGVLVLLHTAMRGPDSATVKLYGVRDVGWTSWQLYEATAQRSNGRWTITRFELTALS